MVDQPVWLNIDLRGGWPLGQPPFVSILTLSGRFASSSPKGRALEQNRKPCIYCQGLPLWGRWHRVSDDEEGEPVHLRSFCPREIVRQNFFRASVPARPAPWHPTGWTHTVAIALGGEEKAALLILHREAGAPQAQRFAQGRAGDALPTDWQGGYIARRGERGPPNQLAGAAGSGSRPSPVRACCICSVVNWTV